jgi:hypothetical protein
LLRRAGFAAIVGTALIATPSAAIISDPLPRICNEFPHSDYVFSGKVLSEAWSQKEPIRGDPARIYRIRVGQVFKRKVPRIVRLFTPANSGGGGLDPGQAALVYAERLEGRIAFSGSSNSLSGPGVPTAIKQLRAYLANPPKAATIRGRIDGWVTGSMAPRPGARLLITDGRIRRFVRADRHGMFFATVRPGRWSVQIAEPGWASRTGVYSYDSAEGTRLIRGGCADLEIETAPSGGNLEGKPQWKRWPG